MKSNIQFSEKVCKKTNMDPNMDPGRTQFFSFLCKKSHTFQFPVFTVSQFSKGVFSLCGSGFGSFHAYEPSRLKIRACRHPCYIYIYCENWKLEVVSTCVPVFSLS